MSHLCPPSITRTFYFRNSVLEISLIQNSYLQKVGGRSHIPSPHTPVLTADVEASDLGSGFLLFVTPDLLSTPLYMLCPPGGHPAWTISSKFPCFWLLVGFSQWEVIAGDGTVEGESSGTQIPPAPSVPGSVLTVATAPEIE